MASNSSHNFPMIYPSLAEVSSKEDQVSRKEATETHMDTSCQAMLQRNPPYWGYLKRRKKVLSVKHWIKCYVVLHGGFFYMYSGPNAKKAISIFSFSGYDRVELGTSRSDLWEFKISPLVDYFPHLTFAVGSKIELFRWLLHIRMAILKAHGITNDKTRNLEKKAASDDSGLDQMFWESSGSESIYSNCNERKIAIDLLEKRIKSGEFVPVSYPIDVVSPENYYDSSIFYGTREEALDEIMAGPKVEGTYLVRKDEKKDVLTVINKATRAMKYIIQSYPNGHIGLENSCETFPNLQFLLYHYHNNDLPLKSVRLIVPYKLANF